MRFRARTAVLTLLALTGLALLAPVAAQAAGEVPVVEKFFAANCKAAFKECGHKIEEAEPTPPLNFLFGGKQKYSVTEPTPNNAKGKEEAAEQGFNTAGGHVPFGITDFKVLTIGAEASEKGESPGKLPHQKPTQIVTHIRTDVAPGLATSPTSVPLCSGQNFGEAETAGAFGIEEIPGLFTAPKCVKASEIGVNEATAYVELEVAKGVFVNSDLGLKGSAYNLEPPKGRASLFGVALKLPKELTKAKLEAFFKEHPIGEPATEKALEEEQWYAHTLIEGNVEWGQEANGTGLGDYHDYFEINVSPELPLVSSRLTFFGDQEGEAGQTGHFITNGTNCPGHHTTTFKETDKEGVTAKSEYETVVGLEGCPAPFEPLFTLAPATTQHDTPDGFTASLTTPRHSKAAEQDTAELKTAEFTLPEGMTMNPSAAAGLTACTPAQARIHSSTPGVACPASSEIGSVALNVPQLPDGSLTGKIYLGGPESGPITGPPYKMYVDAESEKYGVSVRVEGTIIPNEATGRVTTVFTENPEQPFTSIALKLKEGALAPIANPLTCGALTVSTSLTPYTTPATAKTPISNPFTIDSNNAGGACASPAPFAPAQATANQSNQAGAHTSFTFTLERGDGNQYFSGVSTTLPEGLVGAIPAATQCAEGPANSETEECPASSRLGTATILAGAGPTPFTFTGAVYLTGPYQGAPFGLSIKVPAVAGPFNLGVVVARAKITVDQHTARVTTSDASVPRIRRGVPNRIKRITVTIDKQGFLSNPTNCSVLATESSVSGFTLTGEPGTSGSALLSTPFQVANCSALKFKPSFKAATAGRHTRAGGASLETTLNMPAGGANVKSVLVTLPVALPSRQATFSKACLLATFNNNPYECGKPIGGVRANTPLLKDKMTGPVYFVAVGGAQFPDIDLVLNADGVRVIVVGETKITKGITTTRFATPPDVPVSSITVNLPMGPQSALAGFGNFCAHPLYMPTKIEGQNGKLFKQTTKIRVSGCPVAIVGHKVVGRTLYLTVSTPGAGRISAKGNGIATTFGHVRGATEHAVLKVRLTGGGRQRIRVGFVPANRKLKVSTAFATLTL